jgi:hypothetical protein
MESFHPILFLGQFPSLNLHHSLSVVNIVSSTSWNWWLLTRYGLSHWIFMVVCYWWGNSLYHPVSFWNVYRGLHFNSSFYGKWTNLFLLNIGHYREHHLRQDVAWCDLPDVKVSLKPKRIQNGREELQMMYRHYSVLYGGCWRQLRDFVNTILATSGVSATRHRMTDDGIQNALNQKQKSHIK